jgi:hypothetical protein
MKKYKLSSKSILQPINSSFENIANDRIIECDNYEINGIGFEKTLSFITDGKTILEIKTAFSGFNYKLQEMVNDEWVLIDWSGKK